MILNDEKTIEEVKRQFKMTDYHYKKHVESTTIEEVLKADNDERIAILKAWGEIMETYLKGILRWKGNDWPELKNKGHNLKAVYEALDEAGKDLFKGFMQVKSNELADDAKNIRGAVDERANRIFEEPQVSLTENITYDPSFFDASKPMIGYMAYHNREWDGVASLGKRAANKKYSIEAICNMLNMIKVADFRYSNAKGNFNDDFMRTMYDAVRSIHALTIIARGEKKHSI